jgi:iron complex outermembrane recepter protein
MFKRKSVNLAALLALGALSVSVIAQEAQQLERVVVTGSSIKRVANEGALPLTIVSREDIERSGATNVQDLVNLLPSNFGGAVANNNVGATGGASTANLRSLGAKYTLVLLNGRRVANFAFGNSPVDLNSIPLAAVERVEVLRDGASSLYGADAVAGVINFILRRDYQGVELSASKSKSDQKGGDTDTASIAAGIGSLDKNGYNLVFTASMERVDPVKARDRKFADSAVRPDLGVNNSSPRNGIPNLNFTDTLGNSYAAINPLRATGCNAPEFALVLRTDPRQCGTDYVKFIDLVPDQFRANFGVRQLMKVTDDLQLVAELMHTRDRLQSFYSPAPYTKTMTYPAGGRFYPKSITIPKGVTLPAGYKFANGTTAPAQFVLANDINVTPTGNLGGTWRTVAGGGRSDITETENDRVLLGANGTAMGWDFDTAVVLSKNHGEIFFGPGKFSYEKLTPLLASGQINVFGPQDATSLALLNGALITGRQQAATSKSTEFDFRMSRELMPVAGGSWALAVGANYRKEVLNQVSEPVLETGDEVGGNGPVPSVSSGRKVLGMFAETVYPISKELEATASARYDKYKNDFGTSFNNFSPKVSFKYQPMRELTLRGSAAQGFRAPTLYENLRPFTSGNNTSASYSDPIRCPGGTPVVSSINPVGQDKDECDVQLDVATSGERNLKPEKSTQFSLGLGFAPTREITIGLDYWNVDIKDPIVPKSEIQVLGDVNKYKDSYYRYDPRGIINGGDPIKGSMDPNLPLAYVLLPYENTAKVYASGIDLSAAYRTKLAGVGTVGLQYDGTLFVTHGYQYTGLAKQSDLGKFKDFGSAPRYRHSFTMQWANSGFSASVTNTLTSSYDDYTDPTSVDGTTYPAIRKVGAYSLWDMQLGAEVFKGFNVNFGVKNLLNTDPPASRNGLYFQVGFDPTYTNPVGRQFYLSAKYKF